MPKSVDALINPKLLIWARLSAGMNINEASQKLQVPIELLESWEKGSSRPTVKQLRNAAALYNQSFAAFYLPEPPEVFRPHWNDYRRLSSDFYGEISSALLMEVRSAVDRRLICQELYEDLKQSPPAFEAQTSLASDPEQVGAEIRSILKVPIEDQKSWRYPSTAFSKWRVAIESIGILVFQATKISLPEMRGFSIAEFPLPVINVNRKDAYAGRIFTMFHELTHLVLRLSSVCDLDDRSDRHPDEENVEVFCNRAAGAALVPQDQLLNEPLIKDHRGYLWEDDDLQYLSRQYAVSREVILRRLLIYGLTDRVFYESKRRDFQQEIKKYHKTEGFISPSSNLLSSAGKPFVRLVLNAYYADRITTSDIYDYLGINLKHFDKVSRAVRFG